MHIALFCPDGTRLRAAARLGALACALAVAWALGCSSDHETPVGSELVDDVLGSRPGIVFSDTAAVIDQQVLTYYSMIDKDGLVEVGRKDGYERAILLRPDFSKAGSDTNLTVLSAELRVIMTSTDEVLTRFYELATPYAEGDSIESLDTLRVLLDPDANGGAGGARRAMNPATSGYPLDKDTVQAWIRGRRPNNGIAVVYDDAANDKLGQFKSREDLFDPATLKVTYDTGGGTSLERFYKIKSDGTLIRPVQSSPNLVVSDGYVRRIHCNVDLTELGDSAAIHNAVLRFHIVPGTVKGLSVYLVLFVPDSPDSTKTGYLKGTVVQEKFIDEDSGVVQFSGVNMTLALLAILEGEVERNGFTIRFKDENTELRQAEFYTSAAPDSLRPKLIITASSPAEFDR